MVLIGTRQRDAKEQQSSCQRIVNDMEGTYLGAYWCPLDAIEIKMEDTNNSEFFPIYTRGPIVPEDEQEPPKFVLSVTFERFSFISTTTIPERNKYGKSVVITEEYS